MSNKLASVSGKDAIKAFEKAGFTLSRIKGSHHVLKKPGHPNSVVVPVHGQKSVALGTLRSLIADAGLTVEEFSVLL